eukprot:5932810-Amphidinium_carterae.2
MRAFSLSLGMVTGVPAAGALQAGIADQRNSKRTHLVCGVKATAAVNKEGRLTYSHGQHVRLNLTLQEANVCTESRA